MKEDIEKLSRQISLNVSFLQATFKIESTISFAFSTCLIYEGNVSVMLKRLLGKKEEIFMKMNVAYSIDFYSLAEKGKKTN